MQDGAAVGQEDEQLAMTALQLLPSTQRQPALQYQTGFVLRLCPAVGGVSVRAR